MKNKNLLNLKNLKSTGFLLVCTLIAGTFKAEAQAYYQLKIYSIENEIQEQRMDNYLKKAFLPALHRAGIPKAGVFKPTENEPANGMIIYVLVPLQALDQIDKLDAILLADKQYQSDGKDYIDAPYDNPPYLRIESILLKAFREMPETGVPVHSTPPSERIYELRSYQGATEKYYQRKVEMFNEGGEVNIFKELGFNPVFFGEVISGPSMPNLMYMTSFANEASQKEHWSAFSNNPAWKILKEMEIYQNTVSTINKIMLHPADYSDL